MRVLKAVEEVNQRQKTVLYEKTADYFHHQLADKTIALWGLSFKAETDDMREATSLVVMRLLLDSGCKIRVFDPQAMDECRRRMGEKLYYAKDIYDASNGADAILVLTEWTQFRMPDWGKIAAEMKHLLVVDGRNLYIPEVVERYGFKYLSIGRK